MRGTSAVIGVGESRYYKAGAASESEFQLLCTAIKNHYTIMIMPKSDFIFCANHSFRHLSPDL